MQPDQTQVKTLIDELGLSDLSDEEKTNLIAKMSETLQNRIFVALMQELTDEEKIALNNMSDPENGEQVGQFLKDKIPDFDMIVVDAYESFRAEMLETNDIVDEVLNESVAEENQPEQPQPQEQPQQ